MKNSLLTFPLMITASLIIIYACSKSKTSKEEVSPDIRTTTLSGCSAPDYGDSVICMKWKGPNNDYTVKPKNNPGNGRYFAYPEGIVIDSLTGEINVTQSETGARYIVGFVGAGTTDTCTTELVLGGITYLDGIYVLGNNDTLAIPYFNASPVQTSICDPGDDDDYPGNGNGNGQGNNKCEFDDDEDDDNGNGVADEPPPGQQANDKKVRVRTKSGVINLKKTLADGAFGSNPQNGDSVEATIYYRLNDCSSKALQKIKVKIYYYHKKSDIPQTLVEEVEERSDDFLQTRVITPGGKPRPPQIIITGLAY